MRLALDVMGGDHGSVVVLEGLKRAIANGVAIEKVFLAGREDEVSAGLAEVGLTDSRVEIVHAPEVLAMTDKPTDGLRGKRNCSLTVAIELVRDGKADVMLSRGNTGGMLAVATVRLRPIKGVERPGIATVIPSPGHHFVLLDAGANSDCKPEHLLHFALMGNIYAREILGYPKPRVGVLANGTEASKGTELTRAAASLCQLADLNFIGYVEGHDLFANRVDVVVTDGFTGNIVLKTCESMGKGILKTLKSELTASPIRKLGTWLARGAFTEIKKQMDADVYGGAPLLGLNGLVIKAHGSAKEKAIMNAISAAKAAVDHRLVERMVRDVAAASDISGRVSEERESTAAT